MPERCICVWNRFRSPSGSSPSRSVTKDNANYPPQVAATDYIACGPPTKAYYSRKNSIAPPVKRSAQLLCRGRAGQHRCRTVRNG